MSIPRGAFATGVTALSGTFCVLQCPIAPGNIPGAVFNNASYKCIVGSTAIGANSNISVQFLGLDQVMRTAFSWQPTANQVYFGTMIDLCPCLGFQYLFNLAGSPTITYMDFLVTVQSQ